MMKMKPEQMITTEQAGHILMVNASRVRQLIGAGRLQAVKIGRDLFLSRKDVLKFREDRDNG